MNDASTKDPRPMSGRCRKGPAPTVYRVQSIRRCKAPDGAGGRWWRIRIVSVGGAECEWQTSGTREDVADRAARKVAHLNALAGDVVVANTEIIFSRKGDCRTGRAA